MVLAMSFVHGKAVDEEVAVRHRSIVYHCLV